MSQRIPYPNGSPSALASGSRHAADPEARDPDNPSTHPDVKRRPSHPLNPPRTLVSAAQRLGNITEDTPSTALREKQVEAATQTSSWRPKRLTAVLGRRRRWQRYALFGLLLLSLYWLGRSRSSTKPAKPPRESAGPTGQTRRKLKPLHIRTSTPVRAAVPPSVVLQSRSEHALKDGLLVVDMSSRVHPLYQLIRDAREEWDEKVAEQSTTLEAAVEEYKRRNAGRLPPKGFDKWWAYVSENNIPLPDEYDQINRDLLPFRALSPKQLQSRLESASTLPDTYTIRLSSGSIRTSVTFDDNDGQIEGARMRVEGQVELLRDVAKHIPDFTAVYTVHDTAAGSISWGHRAELEELVQDGQYLDEDYELDTTLRGWPSACPNSANIHSYPFAGSPPSPARSFIASHRSSMDLCAHPAHIPMHGLLAGKAPHHAALTPLFCLSKTNLHSDILGVPTEQWSGNVPYVPWEEKTADRLLWRGSNTGSSFSASTPWRQSHRIRLVETAMEAQGLRDMLPLPKKANGRGTLPVLGDGRWEMEKATGNQRYLDVNFTGSAIQCDVNDGTCDELERTFDFVERMTHDDALRYKYVLDVDGNAWSARFQRLLASASLIFKTTVTPEWWTDRIQPWVHYVPIKVDYSDLHDAIAFFRGDLNGQNGEPLLAKQIAAEGKDWVDTHWRQVDMTAYVFRLYLEWARLLAPNKTDADFVYVESMEPGGE